VRKIAWHWWAGVRLKEWSWWVVRWIDEGSNDTNKIMGWVGGQTKETMATVKVRVFFRLRNFNIVGSLLFFLLRYMFRS
jgi:hypothetical protein